MKLYHLMCCWMGVLMRVQNLGGTAPLKFEKAKSVQNLARFRTTFNFDCKYLWNGLTYREAVNDVINCCPFCVEKKFDELWSTNHEVLFAHFDLPKIDSAHVFRTTFDFGCEYLWNK